MATKPTPGVIYVIDPQYAPPGSRWAGRRFRILRNKQVNAVGQEVDESGNPIPGERNLQAKFHLWIRADDPELAEKTEQASGYKVTHAADGSSTTVTPIHKRLHPGNFVVKSQLGAAWKVADTDVFVVIQDRGDKVKLALAGGDPTGRYWPGVPRAWVTHVPTARVVVGLEEDDEK